MPSIYVRVVSGARARQDDGMRFADSVVMVTGGASGLGEAVVRRAVAAGAEGVVVLDANADRAFALSSELGQGAMAIPTDVTDPDRVSLAVAEAIRAFGRIDTLVGCAGIPYATRTVGRDGEAAPIDGWRRIIDVNLVGMFDVVAKAAAAMARNEPREDGERGVIVMTASVAAYEGQVGQTAYSASKGGIIGMTLPLARDLASVGIRVLTIAPGLVDTPIYDLAPPGLKEQLGQTTVFPKRLGRADEFAQLAEALAENGYMNGEVVRMDAAIRMAPK
jgi:NAD(P)-dependent dehydrogenase (short-subunit alcohol dehydrogenase family)